MAGIELFSIEDYYLSKGFQGFYWISDQVNAAFY